MRMLRLVVIALALGSSSAVLAQSKSTPLTGGWRVTYAQTTGPNAATNNNPQPGMFLFTGNHYSLVAVTGDKARPALSGDASKATAAELNATWGPFAANSGTYEIQGGMLTTHPIVAKNTRAMAPGWAGTTYSFKIEGKTLTLASIKSATTPNPITLKLIRIE